MRRIAGPLLAVGLSAAAAAPAAADHIEATRGAPLRLDRARLDVRFADGAIHATVRYDLVNPSAAPDGAQVDLELPSDAVITGVRYRMGDRWLTGRLRTAAAATERYEAYAYGPFVSARGAVLLTDDGSRAQLSLSYLAARGRVPIAYDATVPACFARGRWIAPVPLLDPEPTLHVTGGRVETGADLTRALGEPVADACARFALGDAGALDDADRYLVFDRQPGPGGDATLTAVAAGATTVSELAVAIPDQLAAAPRGAAVVFVLDASRSMGDDGVAAQLAVIRGYLAQVPDARFDVIVFRRRASRLFGELVPASTAEVRLAALAPGALALGNGSNLDDGLALAAGVLARASGPRRLVAFTDDRTRIALDDAALIAALAPLPADAIVHLAVPRAGGESSLVRDFDHRFAAVATRWGGIVAAIDVGDDPGPLVELVRPTRIEAIAVDGPDGAHEDLDAIFEGTGLRKLYTGSAAPAVTGWIWGRRWQPIRTTSRTARVRTARFALGAIGGSLDDGTVTALVGLAAVATRLTSFLADDPSWRPGGLPEDVDGAGSWSTSSMCGGPSGLMGSYGTIGHGSGTGTGHDEPVPELQPLLDARVAACAAPLGAAAWSTEVTIETTSGEIVDVTIATDAAAVGAEARARFDACVVDSAWDLELDARFGRYWSRTFSATFRR